MKLIIQIVGFLVASFLVSCSRPLPMSLARVSDIQQRGEILHVEVDVPPEPAWYVNMATVQRHRGVVQVTFHMRSILGGDSTDAEVAGVVLRLSPSDTEVVITDGRTTRVVWTRVNGPVPLLSPTSRPVLH